MSGKGPPGPSWWDERYGEDEFAYGTEPNDFLKETVPKLDLPKNSKCLMLADGEGRNGVFMARQGFNIVSVDYSKAGLEKTTALAESNSVSVETVLADLADFDFGTEQWDCIVGIYCHLPPPIRSKVLRAIPNSLKPGGYLILECYTPKQLEYKTGGPPVEALMFSSKLLADAFETNDGQGNILGVERNQELVRDVVEGIYHTGKGAVVQFIGRKKGAK